MSKRGARRDYTMEDYLEIKKENKRKLDEIFANPNYLEELGRKYYPDNWLVILDEGHHLKKERINQNTKNALARMKGEYVPYRTKMSDLEVLQLDKETGKKIKTFKSSKEACEELGLDVSKANSIVRCCRGEYNSCYGYKWKFNDKKYNK